MKIMLSFTHPQVLSCAEHKRRYFEECR